jgi:hypothetical protein
MKSGSNPGQFRYAMINNWCPGQWSFEVKKKIWPFKKFSKTTASEYPFDIFKIKVFILTVVENSGICKFNRIYFIEFENIKKSNEITLLAHRVAISFKIY